MSFHDTKHRKHHKPIPTQRVTLPEWLLSIVIGVGIAAALVAWWAS